MLLAPSKPLLGGKEKVFPSLPFWLDLGCCFPYGKTQMNDASCAVVVGGNGMIFTAVVAAVTVVVNAIVEGSI